MSNYSCAYSTGASYFFKLVAYRRQNILYEDALRLALRSAISRTCTERPFVIDAWLLLPDHVHCIWTFPPGDADFSTRWSMIKRRVSLACRESHRRTEMLTASKRRHRGSTIWQRRYWEHQIRGETDFRPACNYIYYNPVKHGHVTHAIDWRYSTLHRDIAQGLYPHDWTGSNKDSGFGTLGE